LKETDTKTFWNATPPLKESKKTQPNCILRYLMKE